MMQETMGQIIKRLRKERNFTQEELAEQLGVTFQAVSKWENDAGLPDISQVVPLATVFGVSTDVLFGLYGKNNAEEAEKLISAARAYVTNPATKESTLQCYRALTDGLAKFPNNTTLLIDCLEAGISLAFPENDTYDRDNGDHIYRDCIRFADLVIKYSQNITHVMRAHMIMVLLHSAYGNVEDAFRHARQFPRRVDMTAHTMNAYMAHFEKDTVKENCCYQTDLTYHLSAVLDDMVAVAFCEFHLGRYENARYAFNKALALIDLLFGDEEAKPAFHIRERGDIHILLAQLSLKEGDVDGALRELEKSAEYDLSERQKHRGQAIVSPLFHESSLAFLMPNPNAKARLAARLRHPVFAPLAEEERYRILLERTKL